MGPCLRRGVNALHRPPHSEATNGSDRAQFVRSHVVMWITVAILG